MDILDKYNIRFFEKPVFNEYRKTMNSPTPVLDQFTTDFASHESVYDCFFPIVDRVLNKDIPKEMFSSQCLIHVEIFADMSNFYEDLENYPEITPTFSLPTSDLKEIIRKWIEYLKGD